MESHMVRRTAHTLLLVLAALFSGLPQAPAQPPQSPPQQAQTRQLPPQQLPPQAVEVHRQFDMAAQQLARILANPAFRMFLYQEIQASPNKENIVDFNNFTQKAHSRPDLGLPPGVLNILSQALAGATQKLGEIQTRKELVAVDLYFPVAEHRKMWRGEEQLLVAFAPLGDEKTFTSITAYTAKDAQRVTLDPAKPPTIPTLVIAAREKASLQRPAGAPITAPQPGPGPAGPPIQPRGISSYIGIPFVKLLNVSAIEPWVYGAPEVYILIGQYSKTYGKIQRRIALDAVDNQGKWYWLGDPGTLYLPFDSTYYDATYFAFWEDDGWWSSTPVTATLYSTTVAGTAAGPPVTLSWSIYATDDSIAYLTIQNSVIPLNSDFYLGTTSPATGAKVYSNSYISFVVDRD